MRNTNAAPSSCARLGSREAGFGLTELMVSLAIVAVVLAGSFRAFDDARRAADIGGMLADGSQNLRMGITLMTRDTHPDRPGTAERRHSDPARQRRGADQPAGAARRGPDVPLHLEHVAVHLSRATVWADHQRRRDGRHDASSTRIRPWTCNQYPLTSILADGSRMTVDARTTITNARTGLRAGDLIWFTNAVGSAIQTVTSVSGQYVYFAANHVSDAFRFNQRTATSGSIMQIRTGTTFPTTSATRVTMVTYYLDSTTAPGQVRLMRREGFQTERLVGSGIENLQLTYDIVDGTVNPTNQNDAVAPYGPSQIRKVNMYLARRSDVELRQTGRQMRSSISTQVSLRSMSFRDRYR